MNMNLKIDELTYSLDTMVMDIEVKSAIINEQDISLNKAYYLFGSQKELKQMVHLFLKKQKKLLVDIRK